MEFSTPLYLDAETTTSQSNSHAIAGLQIECYYIRRAASTNTVIGRGTGR